MKWEQRKLNEQGNALIDMGKMHAELNEQLFEMHKTQEAVLVQVLSSSSYLGLPNSQVVLWNLERATSRSSIRIMGKIHFKDWNRTR